MRDTQSKISRDERYTIHIQRTEQQRNQNIEKKKMVKKKPSTNEPTEMKSIKKRAENETHAHKHTL